MEIRNESIRFEATESTPVDRCFAGAIEFPPRTVQEQNHRLGFRGQLVVPYYFVYSSHQLTGTSDLIFRTRFDFTADEADFVTSIDEIKSTFPCTRWSRALAWSSSPMSRPPFVFLARRRSTTAYFPITGRLVLHLMRRLPFLSVCVLALVPTSARD